MNRLLTCVLLTLTACDSDFSIGAEVGVAGAPNARPVPPTTWTDRFVQTTPPEVDVLWVVDDSGSMQQEQDALAENFPLFLDWFEGSGVDYHLGLVSTDMESADKSGRLQAANGYRWIDDQTPNPESVFAQMASLGIDGSGTETGIAATYAALELRGDEYNLGFRREGASLTVVVISDEEDQTDGDPITNAEFVAWLLGQEESEDDVSFSSIVTPPGVFGPGSETPGLVYLDVTAAVGGVVWDIRDEDWSDLLDQLGIQALGLRRTFPLSRLPVEDTISVLWVVDGATIQLEEGAGWTWSQQRNSIDLVDVPDPKSEILVSYTVRASQ